MPGITSPAIKWPSAHNAALQASRAAIRCRPMRRKPSCGSLSSLPRRFGARHNRMKSREVLMFRKLTVAFALLAAAAQPALALDKLKLAIGQRGLWDSSIAEAGDKLGIFKKHGLEIEAFYTSSGGETLQVVISGSSHIGI